MASGTERRRPPGRRVATLFVGMGDASVPFACTRDLSLSGLLLETAVRPPLRSQLEISLAWGDDVFSCHAAVVRHTPQGIALAFSDPDAYFLQALQEIMDTAPPVPVTPR
ncbi:MAG: PilZ domain-containing protein [Deltaproteobacteria bacterium]|nr:PilZ domain-containing protein [Deltaproteobacteria bacterium]